MVFLAVALLLVLATPALPGTGREARCGAGIAAFKAGDLPQATRLLRQALEAGPGDVACRFALAQVYHAWFEQKGLFYEESVGAYERVIASLEEVESWSPLQTARFLLGRLQVNGGEYREAAEHLRVFLETRPDYAAREAVWNTLGVAHYYMDEYEDAVRAFEQALKADPNFRPARFNLRSVFTRLSLFDVAMANRRAGHFDLALRTLDKLLAIAPRYGPAHLQRALVLRELGRGAEGEVAARRALALDLGPKVAFALRDFLGDALAGRGEVEEALAEYHRCLKIFPGYLQVVEKMDALEKKLAKGEEAGAPKPAGDPPPPPRAGAPLRVGESPL